MSRPQDVGQQGGQLGRGEVDTLPRPTGVAPWASRRSTSATVVYGSFSAVGLNHTLPTRGNEPASSSPSTAHRHATRSVVTSRLTVSAETGLPDGPSIPSRR